MPDHAHLVLEGRAETSDLRALMHVWKQRTAFEAKQLDGQKLWHRSYYDRVLRDDEGTDVVCGYVLMNPVRAGLVTDPAAYPFSGSQTTTIEDLLLRAAQSTRTWTP